MNELTYIFQENPVRTMLIQTEPWFALVDVCTVLGISNSRMVWDRLDNDEKDSVSFTDTIGRSHIMQAVNEPGLYDTIIRSNSEQAKPFRRWVTHEVLPSLRKQGFYSLLSDEELVAFITERQKLNSSTLDLIDKPKIKRVIMQEERDKRMEETRQVWVSRFGKHETVDVPKELRRIWRDDMPMYHKFLDKFHTDENKERRGHIVTI